MSGDRPRASIWTRELMPSCTLGYIEPIDVAERRRQLIRLLPWLVAGVLLVWGWSAWLQSERAAIDMLAQTDRVEAARHPATFIGVAIGSAVLLAVGACAWAVVAALRALRAGRSPRARARPWQHTRVIGGWCLRLRFGLVLLLAPASAAFLVHTGARLVGWAWNTYADARASDASGSAVTAQPERTEP